MVLKPIEKNSLSESVRRKLLSYIEANGEEQNWKLPSEQEMAERLGVSRNTLRQTLSQLDAEGIIVRKHGQGTYINPEAQQVNVDMREMIDFSDIVRKCGHNPSHRIYSLTEEQADPEMAGKLKISPGDALTRVEYWIYADGVPAIVVAGWVADSTFPEAPSAKEWEQHSCFQVLYEYTGVKIKSDRVRVRSLTAGMMNRRLGHTTELRCKSVLSIDSVGFDQRDEPIIYGMAYFDTSIIEFDLFRTAK